tara:strand:- start:35239 stop:36606 length:1368 start_codon:yes stop_codon:yes gene_type:complete
MITGKDLIELGYEPAKWFAVALSILNGRTDPTEKEIREVCDARVALIPVHIPLREFPAPFAVNLYPHTEEEMENFKAVIAATVDILKVPTTLEGTIMPDACPVGGKNIPVGVVVGAVNAIHPSWHSADMCCSVYATNFGKVDPKTVLDAAHKITHFGAGGRKGLTDFGHILTDNKELYDRLMANYYTKDYIEKACRHLGTQGDGNHFLFVGISEQTGDTMLVTHHGSRGFGASVYKKGMDTAEKFRRKLSPETDKSNAWIPADELEGELYWDAIQIVRDWTKLNHATLHNKTLNAVKIAGKGSFWNEHNSVFKDGDIFWHAKGVTPMADKFVPDSTDGLRLIPLNMSEPILVAKAAGSYFAPHGAGRNVSRAAHRKKKEGKTVEEVFAEETKGLDVRFFSGNIDVTELPSAYKDAETVQAQIESYGLGAIVDRIMPYGCIMAGDFKRDFNRKKSK